MSSIDPGTRNRAVPSRYRFVFYSVSELIIANHNHDIINNSKITNLVIIWQNVICQDHYKDSLKILVSINPVNKILMERHMHIKI